MKFKNLLSILIVLLTLFLLSGTALAIPITNEAEFLAIGTDSTTLAGIYELTVDLDFSTPSSFTPIGTVADPFTGKFDGQGHEITGIDYSAASGNNYGIFKSIDGAEIKNLNVTSSTFSISSSGGNYVGILAGRVDGGSKIENVILTDCSVSSVGDYVGMLAGWVNDSTVSNVTITFSASPSNYIVGGNDQVGGLIGNVSDSTIKACAIYDIDDIFDVIGVGQVGGLAGNVSDSEIESCYIIAYVTATGNNVGGLVGDLLSSDVKSSFYIGNVDGVNNVGGLVGRVDNSDISQCFTFSDICGVDRVGGFIGVIRGSVAADSTLINDSFFIGSAEGTANVGSFVGRVNSNTEELKIKSSYAHCENPLTSDYDLLFISNVESGAIGAVAVEESFNRYDLGASTYGISIDDDLEFGNIDTFTVLANNGGYIQSTPWDIDSTLTLSSTSVWYLDATNISAPLLRFSVTVPTTSSSSSSKGGSGTGSARIVGNQSISSPNPSPGQVDSTPTSSVPNPVPTTSNNNTSNVSNTSNNNTSNVSNASNTSNTSSPSSIFNWQLIVLVLVGIVIIAGVVYFVWNKKRVTKMK